MEQHIRSSRWRHIRVLALAVGVLAAGLLLEEGVERVSLSGRVLPNVCWLRGLHDAGCPGCGLTRSVVAFLHLRWRESLTRHPAGVLIVAVILLEITFRLSRLLSGRSVVHMRWIPPVSRCAMICVLVLSTASWFWRCIS